MRKAIIVGVNVNQSQDEFEYSMQELANLADACNIEVVGELTQNLQQVNKAHYLGTGKVEELKALVDEKEASIVIFDDELSPSQIRNIDADTETSVMDRTMLILDIFAERAKTRESQLQVEIAQLKYMLPRLIGMRTSLGRQGGGAGLKNRGAGETKLELDRRKIEEKIASMNKELEKVLIHRKTQRSLRKKNAIPVVSIVGYTNAGKSTMMNAMVERYRHSEEKQVFEKDMLFATLETSVREMMLPDQKRFLLTDTVGFINKLPHHLVKAFRSTLEEVIEADLLIHVLDASNPHHELHKRLTNEILQEIGAGDIPMIYAYNKVDQTDLPYPMVSNQEIYLSAKNRMGIEELTSIIRESIFKDYVRCDFLIPYTNGEIVSYFNEHGHVLTTEYEENGTLLAVECSPMDAEKYAQYRV